MQNPDINKTILKEHLHLRHATTITLQKHYITRLISIVSKPIKL